MRFVFLDHDTRLLFATTYDGDWDTYIDDFSTKIPDALDRALTASGLDHIIVTQRPRLLSDNGSSYVADDLATWLEGKDMQHVRGAPYLPGDLERQIGAFVEYYNHVRYHESLNNLTRPPYPRPAGACRP